MAISLLALFLSVWIWNAVDAFPTAVPRGAHEERAGSLSPLWELIGPLDPSTWLTVRIELALGNVQKAHDVLMEMYNRPAIATHCVSRLTQKR